MSNFDPAYLAKYLKGDNKFYLLPRSWNCRTNPTSIYPLKVDNRNIRARCELWSKLTIKTPERSQ